MSPKAPDSPFLNEERRIESKMFWIAVCSSVVALLATCAAVWSAYEAHKTRLEGTELARHALQLQNEALELGERPYLTVDFNGMSKEDLQVPDTTRWISLPAPHIKITEHGHSPALQPEVHIACEVVITKDSPHLKEAHPPQRPGTLFDGQSVVVNCLDLLRWDSSQMYPAIHIVGRVDYRDRFHVQHSTPFCIDYLTYDKTAFNCISEDPT